MKMIVAHSAATIKLEENKAFICLSMAFLQKQKQIEIITNKAKVFWVSNNMIIKYVEIKII